jgi:pimeloyl-ACP methyl ester carboxylesterase
MPYSALHRAVVLVGILCLADGNRIQAQSATSPYNPATSDPDTRDSLFPPGADELQILSMGARLNGFIYLASGPGPHPTVVLLHGFPGNERNLDLAQALRRAGDNVLYFNYRGSWGSGGTFSFAHSLEDAEAVIWFLRSDAAITKYRIDPSRIALVGHSMGAWVALFAEAADSAVACAAALDIWNVGADGPALRGNAALDTAFTDYHNWLTAPGAPLTAPSGQALTDEIKAQGTSWDVASITPLLTRRPVLLLSTAANEYHDSIVSALQATKALSLTALKWNTDHGFSNDRIRLEETVIAWLQHSCAF